MSATEHASREQRRQLRRNNDALPAQLVEVPESAWPAVPGLRPIRVMRSRDYLLQVFADEHPLVLVRLTLCRTHVIAGQWQDGIGWDDLQDLKAQAGFAFFDAVEVYPDARYTVNVANMRHLWVMREPLAFKWRS